MSSNDAGDAESPMQKFELYIKASAIDKETKGSCPICQQFFMITCLLGENQDDIDFKVFTVQADCPPKNFAAGWSKKYPVVMVNSGRNKMGQDISGMMYDTFEELETFFESINRECPELKRKNAPNQAAMAVVENVYKHFNHFISGQPERGLVAELRKVNEFLESNDDKKYLVDNVLTFSDCHLLPRLQHIRVAGKAYRGWDIPSDLTEIWRYLKSAYEQDAFKSTMPSDQDIIFHYEKKAGGPPRVRGKRSTLEKFTYTMDIPDGIFNGVGNGGTVEEVVPEAVPAAPEPVPEPEPEPEPEPVVADTISDTPVVVVEESEPVVQVDESEPVVQVDESEPVVQAEENNCVEQEVEERMGEDVGAGESVQVEEKESVPTEDGVSVDVEGKTESNQEDKPSAPNGLSEETGETKEAKIED